MSGKDLHDNEQPEIDRDDIEEEDGGDLSEDEVVSHGRALPPKPKPVALASVSGDPEKESLGDLPPVTNPGASTRIVAPPTIPVVAAQAHKPPQPMVAMPAPKAAPKPMPPRPLIGGGRPAAPPLDPGDATSAFSRDQLKDALKTPSDAPARAAAPPKLEVVSKTPPLPATVEADGEDRFFEDEVNASVAKDKRGKILIGGALAAAALIAAAFMIVAGGSGLGFYAWLNGGGGSGSGDTIAVAPPPLPEPDKFSASTEYFVVVAANTVLAPVDINGEEYRCTIVEYDRTRLEDFHIDWPTLSTYERWQICAKALRKGPSTSGGEHTLIVGEGEGEKAINLEEVIVTQGGETYTALLSTPSVFARCWGSGQVNGDGQPSCTVKPPQYAKVDDEVKNEASDDSPPGKPEVERPTPASEP